MLEFAKAVHIYAELSRVRSGSLDLMALELGTQYYDHNFPRSIKELILPDDGVVYARWNSIGIR